MIPSSVVRSSLVVALLLACSPPSRPAPPAPKAIDVFSHPYTFPWDSLRRWFENVSTNKPPCDYRDDLRVGKVGTGDCTAPVQLAAKVQAVKVVHGRELHAEVTLDLGSEDGITKDWHPALLDEHGWLATTWEHADHVSVHRSFLTFWVKDKRVMELKRAALVKERP